MSHAIYQVIACDIVAPYTLNVTFDDQTSQRINFEPVLHGEMYGALQDLRVFNQVKIDPEIHTLVWPNGADFDPATLHDWPRHLPHLQRIIEKWREANVYVAA